MSTRRKRGASNRPHTTARRPARPVPTSAPQPQASPAVASPAPEHDTLAHVHVTAEGVASLELTPPHPPREDTPEYRAAHRFLIDEKDAACAVCGVRKSTLGDPAQNRYGAAQMESHHYPIERSLADACDPRKVHEQFPQVYDAATLMQLVDSPANLIVLCDIHHRSPDFGIHHLLTQDWAIQPFLRDGYRVVATAKENVAALVSADEAIADATAESEPTHE